MFKASIVRAVRCPPADIIFYAGSGNFKPFVLHSASNSSPLSG